MGAGIPAEQNSRDSPGMNSQQKGQRCPESPSEDCFPERNGVAMAEKESGGRRGRRGGTPILVPHWIRSHLAAAKRPPATLEKSAHVTINGWRAVSGEVYIWKGTPNWVGGSLALSGLRSPAWHQRRWAVPSPPCWAWLSSHEREGLVPTHPSA